MKRGKGKHQDARRDAVNERDNASDCSKSTDSINHGRNNLRWHQRRFNF
jgi:hypothetical protein